MTISGDGPEHLDSVRVAAYAEGTLTGGERAAVEAHLAECARCRAEATEVALLLRVGRDRRRWWLGVPAAAAAAALVLIAGPLGEPDAGERLRPGVDADREGIPAIEVVLPAGDASVSPDSVRFVWRDAGRDVLYRLTLTDESGAVVWEASASDTVLALPREVELDGGRRYLWYVDAALPDGRVATTGVRELRIR